MTLPASPLSTLLWTRITRTPNHAFWITPQRAFTYGELQRRVEQTTAHIRQAGVPPGGIVLVSYAEGWLTFTAWLAALLNGAVPVLVSSQTKPPRRASIAKLTEPHLIFASDDPWPSGGAAPVIPEAALSADKAGQPPSLSTPDDDLAYIHFTSGTTGAPKGVMISHQSLAAQLATLSRLLQIDGNARIFNGLVLHHADGLIQGPLLALYQGGTVLRPGPFDTKRLPQDMAWLAEQDATHMMSAPPILELIDRHCPRDDYFAHPAFRMVMTSSAPLLPDLWDRFEKRFGTTLVNQYGMTETVACSHFAGGFKGLGARHTIGRPVDCEARIVDRAGRTAAEGELQIKGACVFAGYYADPDRTTAGFDDGWLRTGDLVRITSDGDYHLIGRLDEAINSGGTTLRPEEIDEAVLAIPGIDAAKTVGLPDPLWGDIAATAYVSASGMAEADVFAACRAALEPLKVPKRIKRVDALPRTPSGKPALPALRALFETPPDTPKNTKDVTHIVMETAADIFGTRADNLALDQTPDQIAGWDSFAHTALFLALDAQFDRETSPADIAAVGCLRDVVTLMQGGTLALPARTAQTADTLTIMPDIIGGTRYLAKISDALAPDWGTKPCTATMPAQAQTLQDMARLCADQIATDTSARPVLIGYSFAGFLAYETAALLAETACPARAVILLDTAVPWRHRRARHLHWLAEGARRLRRRDDPENSLRFFVPGLGWRDLGKFPERERARARHAILAQSRYKPTAAQVPMLVLAARFRQKGRIPMEAHLGWARFNSGPITTHMVGDSHLSAVQDPATAQLAARHIADFLSDLP